MQSATPAELGFSSARLERIGPVLRRFVDEGKVAGLVALAARHGRFVYCDRFGSLDVEVGKPMPLDAIFRIFSMSKPVTAIAIAMLLEEGRFALDDPLADYIPEFAATKVLVKETEAGVEMADLERPITIRHLLMHTSGLGYGLVQDNPVDVMYFREAMLRPDEPLAQKLPRLARLPLLYQPGTGWHYSISIDVLGGLVEAVSSQSFDRFLEQRLFNPLGMADTSFQVPAAEASRVATVYAPLPQGGIQHIDDPRLDATAPVAFPSGGGGLLSTAADYARFAQMLLNGGELDGVRLLSRKTVELFTNSQMTRDQIPFVPAGWPFRLGYGMALGMRTLIDASQSGMLGSAGTFTWQGAAGTDFWVDPKEDLLGVVMTQVMPGYYRPAEMFRTLLYAALTD